MATNNDITFLDEDDSSVAYRKTTGSKFNFTPQGKHLAFQASQVRVHFSLMEHLCPIHRMFWSGSQSLW